MATEDREAASAAARPNPPPVARDATGFGGGGAGHVATPPEARRGWADKMALGRSALGRRNWQSRYFVLSRDGALTYHASPGGAAKGPPIDVRAAVLNAAPTAAVHPAVAEGDPGGPYWYLMLTFVDHGGDGDGGEPRKLLLRFDKPDTHAGWRRALSSWQRRQ